MRIRQPIEVARLEEARCTVAVSEIAAEYRPWCGGRLIFETPGSWANFAGGMSFDHDYTDADVDELVDFYVERGVEPRLEMPPFVPDGLFRPLAQRRFTVRQTETIFACEMALRSVLAQPPTTEPLAGLTIEVVDVSDVAAVRTFAEVATRGFIDPGEPEDLHVPIAIKAAHHPRALNVLARTDGEPAGAGGIEIAGELATLYGVSVERRFRNRGIQLALIEHRLDVAAERGCTLATISSKPGVATERNALRAGFVPSYAKLHLAMAGDGLAPSKI